MRSTHRCLGLDGPGPSGFNERIHKKQVLPYLGSSQNYLFPCISSEPNFNPTKILGILVFKVSFLNVLKSKKDTFLLNHLARKISTEISKKLTCFLLCSPRIHISKFSSNLHANYYFASSTSQSNSNICGLRLGTTL